jgi:spectinomycin phosphotransferase
VHSEAHPPTIAGLGEPLLRDSRVDVDTPPPAALDLRSMRAALEHSWSIVPGELGYVPKGVGSYHWRATTDGRATRTEYFITVDDLDTKPWIGRDRDSTFTGLVAAYETAAALHDRGLELVVPPLPSDDGAFAVRLDEQYTIAVFPFIDGKPGDWGDPISPVERDHLLRELARLHAATPNVGTRIDRRRHELFERDVLLDALANLDQPWDEGAYSERARHALADHASAVMDRLARFDALAAQLERAEVLPVVTHGEPHPGNLLRTRSGLRLIDWDTVALAEPERDVWMLDALDAYIQKTGTPIDEGAIEFYRLAWTLSDIASFTDLFRRDQPRTHWAERKWGGFVALLNGAPSVPYAPS